MPWVHVEVVFGDERAVDPTHPASNFGMARETLLDAIDLAPEQIHRMPAERPDLDAAARDYQAELARVAGVAPDGAPPQLDVVLLGMGGDAHTASLFPGTPAARERERWVVPGRAPVAPFDRLTLTFPVLNTARCVVLLVRGADKAAVLADVLEGPRDPERLPCQSLQPSAGRVVWLVYHAAASQLRAASR